MGYLIIGIIAFLLGWWIRDMECKHEHGDNNNNIGGGYEERS